MTCFPFSGLVGPENLCQKCALGMHQLCLTNLLVVLLNYVGSVSQTKPKTVSPNVRPRQTTVDYSIVTLRPRISLDFVWIFGTQPFNSSNSTGWCGEEKSCGLALFFRYPNATTLCLCSIWSILHSVMQIQTGLDRVQESPLYEYAWIQLQNLTALQCEVSSCKL